MRIPLPTVGEKRRESDPIRPVLDLAPSTTLLTRFHRTRHRASAIETVNQNHPTGNDRTPLRIDVFSDTICPWCWIGKRRLDRTLESLPHLEANVLWHAFQLNPSMPAEGMDRREYLETKFGGADNARATYGRVIAEGARESLPFDFSAIARTPNTLDSHRLVRWAANQAPGQEPMVEALFEAYFARGEDVGDRGVLARVASEAGYDGSGATALLAGEEGRAEATHEDMQARRAGITGVPCFILDGKVAVPGAVEPEVFLRVFDEHGIGTAAPSPA